MNKAYLKRIFKITLWIVIAAALYFAAAKVLTPKYLYSSSYQSPETEVWNQFYSLPKDSLDVLIIGSSQVYNGIDPTIIYEDTNLTSFNLVCSEQDVPTAYFYLKEALKSQHPQCVLLEAYGFHNGSFLYEDVYTRSLSYMHLDDVRIEAMRSWRNDGSIKLNNPFYDIVSVAKFHDRWSELTECDFDAKDYYSTINGYAPCVDNADEWNHESFYFEDDPDFELDDVTLNYFDKICALCSENGINLILTKTPNGEHWRQVHSQAVAKASLDRNIPFVDYNVEELLAATGIVSAEDYKDGSHLNSKGAEKFSKAMARDLLATISPAHNNRKEVVDYWNSRCELRHAMEPVLLLQSCDSLWMYLEYLNNPDFIVYAAANGEYLSGFYDELTERIPYNLILPPDDYTNDAKIIIDGHDYAVNEKGLNMVVWSQSLNKVVDSVAFDVIAGSNGVRKYN